MSATVYEDKYIRGAATHAIVIGVGHYPHLPGGGGKPTPSHCGMRQLKSPPASARAMARWLIEKYQHPTKPLASVSLLLSERRPAPFDYFPKAGPGIHPETFNVPPATMAEVRSAVKEWHKRGNENPDHLLLFYFCGHGVAASPRLGLILSDFGADETAPFDGSLDFGRFRINMDECAAREQVYFVDACREGALLAEKNDGFIGLPIIQSTGALNHSGRVRQAPVFYATLAGSPAFGKPGKPSLFTSALLQGLAGAGCDESQPGKWQVQTTLLHDALNKLMRDASERLQLPQKQINPADELTLIELNVVQTPQVPVVVGCLPTDANLHATLGYRNGTAAKTRRPAQETWQLYLPPGDYDFSAKFATAQYKPNTRRYTVRPTFRNVQLPVT